MGAKVIGSFGNDPIPASDVSTIDAQEADTWSRVLMGEVIVIGSCWPIQIGESLLLIFPCKFQPRHSLKATECQKRVASNCRSHRIRPAIAGGNSMPQFRECLPTEDELFLAHRQRHLDQISSTLERFQSLLGNINRCHTPDASGTGSLRRRKAIAVDVANDGKLNRMPFAIVCGAVCHD